MSNQDISIFLAGDALMTQPWAHIQDAEFERLIGEMRAAGATIVNLETVIHEFKGYAQAHSGGTYMASPPEIANELAWAGINMVSHANNHTFDYGSTGILETHEHVNAAGIILSGSGTDLQEARAPRYLECSGGTVGMVSMASSFTPYGKASWSRSDVHGRPGLNPLTLTKDKVATITPAIARVLSGFNRLRGRRWENPERNSFKIGRIHFRIGEKLKFVTGRRIIGPDQAANLGAIREAASHADITLASVHAHKHGNWLREFARTAIAEGADIIFVHGPHKIRGMELHDGKPIFYGMGDFVFQSDQITRLPSEAYERFRLGDDATAKDLLIARSKAGLSLFDMRSSFEAYAAVLEYQGGKVTKIRLLPLDLQFDAGQDTRGQPRFADPRLGKDIIGRVAELSSQYSTEIHYHSGSNCGIVELA